MLATTISLPVIDLDEFRIDPTSETAMQQCNKLAEAIKTFGAFAVRDSRVTEIQNAEFLDLMEDYFEQPTSVKMQDVRAGLSYQVGATPENIELPRCGRDPSCMDMVEKMDLKDRPFDFTKAGIKPNCFLKFFHFQKSTSIELMLMMQILNGDIFGEWESLRSILNLSS